jgi:hypothetical protein
MTQTELAAPLGPPAVPGRARARASWASGWPLSALLMLYPLWWALGLGTLIVFILAVPMLIGLARRKRISVPPGFGLWVFFLVWLVISTVMLSQNPPGTLAAPASSRTISVAFNMAGYLSATVILLYAGNLTEAEFPRRKLVRQLGFLFIVVVAGGILGVLAPRFAFTSLTERLLPAQVAQNGFVQSLVHPSASQLQDVLGYSSGRPSAPFGYTNTWGDCLALLLGFFVVSWLHKQSTGRRIAGLVILAIAAVPIVYSLNRGLWIGIGLIVVIEAVRLAMRGRYGALTGVIIAAVLAVALVLASPLASIINQRLDNQKSNGIRSFTIEKTLDVLEYSPIIGFGSTRAALGSSNSIAVGQSNKCLKCGNPTLGSNGQLWLLLIAQGIGGALLYVGFFLRSLWAYRRDRTALGDAALIAVALPLWFMFVYNALTMPLVISFLAIALLWRNQRVAAAEQQVPLLPAFRGQGYWSAR